MTLFVIAKMDSSRRSAPFSITSAGEQSSPCRSATSLLVRRRTFRRKAETSEGQAALHSAGQALFGSQLLTRPTTVIPSDSEESISETACLVWILHGAALLRNDGCRGITHLVCQSTSVLSHVVKHGLHVVVLFEPLQERIHVVFLLLREFNGAQRRALQLGVQDR